MIPRSAVFALALPFASPVLAEGFLISPPLDCDLGTDCFIQQYVDSDPSSDAMDFTCAALSYDGHKGTDFPLALNNQQHGHRLHTAGRQAAGDFGPQQRRDHETHHTVEETTCLLRLDVAHIQITGPRKRLIDGFFGDLIKDDPPIATLVAANGLLQMPSPSLSKSVAR